MFLAIALVGSIVYLNRGAIRSGFDVAFGAEYSDNGVGSVEITIRSGDDGEDVARALVEAGVTRSFGATYRTILELDPIFYPGIYRLPTQINSHRALEALTNNENKVDMSVVIPEGLTAGAIFKILSARYGIKLSEFEELKPGDLGLPEAAVNLDGYLFPAKYTFEPGQTALEMLEEMHRRMLEELSTFGVRQRDFHKVLTIASIIQREGKHSSDFYKISRVFMNRLQENMPLQSDATVSYGVGVFASTTTADQRADDNPWNTYLHPGLPAGPISAPGRDAIDAALHPAAGSWLFFCTINLETGETEFTTTLAEHEASVAKWRAWMKANPGW